MAVNCFSRPSYRTYLGLASDTKPTLSQVPGDPIIATGDEFWETDTGKFYRWTGTEWIQAPLPFALATAIAGESQSDSTSGADHLRVAAEGAVRTVTYSDGDTTLYAGPALLFGFRVTTALSAHAWTIDDNATARIGMAASLAVGIYKLPCAVIFETSLVCNVNASASAGVVEFYFRPLDPTCTWAY